MPLYPYQREGARWLASKSRALLADEPGLGKTAQAITAMDFKCLETILITCPSPVRFVWKAQMSEYSLFGHDINMIETAKDRPKRGCVNIVGYGLLARGFYKTSWEMNAFLKSFLQWEWDLVIGDESHYLKDAESARTRATLEARAIHGKTKRLWLISGTPMPNHPGELWTMLAAFGATQLSYGDFCGEYCVMGTGMNADKPLGTKPEKLNELRALLRPHMKRRYKEFVMPQLPQLRIDDFPLPEVPIKVEQFFEDALADKPGVTRRIAEQKEFIAEVWRKAMSAEGVIDPMNMIQILEGVGPSVALYRRWLGAVKAASILPILKDELANNAYPKIAIFYHHKQVAKFLRINLKEFNPMIIDGSVSHPGRAQAIRNFEHDPSQRVALLNIIAAGTGVDGLQYSCSEAIILEPDWVPANNAQAVMRLHRIGQKKPVRARVARLADTLDDYISDTLARKTREITAILRD